MILNNSLITRGLDAGKRNRIVSRGGSEITEIFKREIIRIMSFINNSISIESKIK